VQAVQNFLAIFTASDASRAASGWGALSEAEAAARRKAGIDAWNAWVERHKDLIVDHGSPIGKTKRVGRSGVSDATNTITAYTVVRAESHEAAAAMFENHPHFTIFPGEAVEIMPCLPVPGA
jgi:hypothetical protein